MSKTFVIPDLHGRFDLFLDAMTEIRNASHSGGTIILLGDYVDRGFDGNFIIANLMAGAAIGWKMIPLMGNHEQMMYQSFDNPDLLHSWINNGASTTLLGYGAKFGEAPDLSVIPKEHIDFIKTKMYQHYEDEHRIYIHAGCQDNQDPNDLPLDAKLWFRPTGKTIDAPVKGKHVVHGHTPNPDGPELFNYRTNLDVAAYYTGKLTIGVFDDDTPGGPVSFLHVEGPDIKAIVEQYKAAHSIP